MKTHNERQLTGEPKSCSAFVSDNTMRNDNFKAFAGTCGRLSRHLWIGLIVLFAVLANLAYAQGSGPTFTELSVSPSDSTAGSPVTLSAVVDTGGGAPTGAVSFYDCGKLLGSGPVAISSSKTVANYVRTSDNLAANWTVKGEAAISASPVAAPFANSLASTLSTGSASGWASQIIPLIPPGIPPMQLTLSVWLQGASGSAPVTFQLMNSTGNYYSKTVAVTPVWTRYSMPFAIAIPGPVTILIGGSNLSVQVWGIQLEAAAAAGPYVSTSSGATTGVGGIASLTLTSLAPGAHDFTASYSGNYNSSTSTAAWAWIFQSSLTSVASSANPSLLDRAVTFTATVTGGHTGDSVTFFDGTNVLGKGALNANGAAALTVPSLSLGTHQIMAAYGGESLSNPSMSAYLPQVVQTNDSLTLQALPATVLYGMPVVLNAAASSSSSLGPMTGTVEFMDSGTVLGSAPLSNGTAIFMANSLTAGTHWITAQYLGDSNYTPRSSNTAMVTVNGLPTSVSLTSTTATPASGVPITYTATVTPSGATGYVRLLDSTNDTYMGLATLNSSGVATFSAALNGAGVHAVIAYYYGSTIYASSTSSPLNETVKTVPVITFTSPAPGQSVVVGWNQSATVTLTTGATGTVTIALDGVVQGSSGLYASTATVWFLNPAAVGSHTLTASYSGDSNFSPTSSTINFQVVKDTPSIVWAPSADAILSNQDLFVSARVTSRYTESPCYGMLSGTVTVLANGTSYGTFPAEQIPVVQVPAGTLSPGSATIAVEYSGDSNCNSVTVSQAVAVTDFKAVATPVWLSNSGDPMGPFTAQLFASSNPVPTGSVTLDDGATALATGTVSAVSAQNLLTPPLVVLPNFCTDDECSEPGMALDPKTVAPDGSISALAIDDGGEVNFGGPSCTPGQPYQLSVFALGAGQQLQFEVAYGAPGLGEFGVGTATSNSFSTSANWQQYSFAFTPPAGTTWCTILIESGYVPWPQSTLLDIWGLQVQQGTSVGPYIRGYVDGVESNTRTAYVASIPAMLATGAHALKAAYSGDANYKGGTSEVLNETVTATQSSTVSLQSSTSNPIAPYGATVGLVTNVVPAAATGTVSFYDGQTLLAIEPVSNGTATYSTTALAVGVHSLVAVYSGDNTYLGSKSAVYTETIEAVPVITFTAPTPNQSVVVGWNQSATVTLPTGATGTVTIALDGVVQGSNPLYAYGTLPTATVWFFNPAAVGSHTLTASYSGDSNFAPASSTSSFQVVKDTPLIVWGTSAAAILNNQDLFISGKLTSRYTESPCYGMASGTVTVLANGTSYGTFPVGQIPLVQVPAGTLSPGSATITVQYSGDSNCNAVSDSKTIAVTDFKTIATPVWLSDSGDSMGPFTAQLFASSNPAPTGSVTLDDGATALATGTVSAVSAQNLLSPPLVVWPAYCTDDECTDPGMALDPTTVAPDGSISAYAVENGGEVYFGAVSCTPGQTNQFSVFALGAGQQIQLQFGSVTSNWFSTTANWQQYSIAYTPPAGTTWCTILIDSGYLPWPQTTLLDIWGLQIQQGTSVGPYIRGYVDGVESSTRTAYVASIPAMLTTGAHALKAVYSGDATYKAGTSEVLNETVTATESSTVSLQSSTSNPDAPYGATVGLVASVAPASATGTISFYDGQTLLAAQPVSNGTATYSTTALAVGVHSLVAVYSGDNTYLGSKSAVYTETIEADAAITFNAPTPGQSVIVGFNQWASVTLTNGATGTVTFVLDGVDQGSSPLYAYGTPPTATIWFLNPASFGSHTLTASYSGDSNFAPTSSTIGFQVVKDTPSLVWGTSAAAILNNQDLFITGKLTSRYGESPCYGMATGTITVLANGTAVGTGVDTFPAVQIAAGSLSPGNATITVQYSGDSNCNAVSDSKTIAVTDFKTIATPVWLSNSGNPMGPFTAQLFASSNPAPTGSVTLDDGATALATGTVSAVSAQNLLSPPLVVWPNFCDDDECSEPGMALDPTTVAPDGSVSAIAMDDGGEVNFGGPSCTPGQMYQFSAFALGAGQQIQFEIAYGAPGLGEFGVGTASSNWFSTTANWQQYSFAFTPPAGTVWCTILIESGYVPWPQSTLLDIWGLQVQQGTSVGPYIRGYVDGVESSTRTVYAASIPATLTTGAHALKAVYSGDATYKAGTSEVLNETVTATESSTVSLQSSTSNPDAPYGATVGLVASVVPASATGTISFYDGQTLLAAQPVSNGTATYSTTTLAAGVHSLVAVYSGDNTYLGSKSAVYTETIEAGAAITFTAPTPGQSVVVGWNQSATVTLPAGATGTVTMALDGVVQGTSPLYSYGTSPTTTVWFINPASFGSHSLTATYSGDSNFAPSSSTIGFQVVKDTPSLVWATSAAAILSNQDLFVSGKVTSRYTESPCYGMATGTVTVLADGTVYGTATNTFPLVLIPANSLNIGSITITVRYSGDSNCNAVSDSETVSVTDFTQVATPVWLSNSGDVMGPFTAQLFASNPAPAPMIDTMTLYDGTTGLNTATVSGVSAQNLLSPPLVVWPNFCTDDECTDWGMWLDTNTVAPDGSISAYTMELYNEVNIGSVSCTPGQTYQFSVFAQGAGQQIQLQLGSATSDWFSTSANWQEYSVAYTPPDGTAWCTAEIQNSYGSSNSLDIWGPQIQQGTTVGPYIRGYLDGVENSTRTAYAASVPAMLATGAHALTAAFSGDTNGDNYMPGTSEVLHETVTATQPSSVSLQSSTSNPVTTSGTTVGLVANVVPATATGTVSFFNGQTLLAIQPVNNGTAAYSTSTLPVGVDNLVAVYSGDNTFLGSKSAAYTETVETNDTLTLTAATTVRTILPDVLSATVSPSSATGTVEFFSNGNSIGGAPLSNGGAVLLKVFQVPGTYLITAQYSGDSNDSPQTSNTVTVTVIPLF